MNNIRLIAIILLLCGASPVFSQHPLLQSGPMMGYNELREVALWVQTAGQATVAFEYSMTDSAGMDFASPPVMTVADEAFTATVVLNNIMPGKSYEYHLLIDGERVELPYETRFTAQADWQFKTDPPAFRIAAGSCTYVNEPPYDRPGRPYGGDYQIFTHIHAMQPDLMLWLGDNTYFRPADWNSVTGMQHRYTHTRSLPELQPLLASAHHYAIWDDHDYGPNDSDRSFAYKDMARRVFDQFWANPRQSVEGLNGITNYFQFQDIEFFMLDNRYFRSPNRCKTCEHTLLGREQLDWLVEALSFSRAPFKMVLLGGQFASDAPVFENYAHIHYEERAYLLERLENEDIRGLIFITGDRHHSELSRFESENGWFFYDLTLSPLTAGPTSRNIAEEPNNFRVDGTIVTQRNFGIIDVEGPRLDRRLHLHVYDADGNMLWDKVIERSEWE